MTLRVLLSDWSLVDGSVVYAGELIDDGEPRYATLFGSGAPFADHNASQDAVIAGYRAMARKLPSNTHVDLTAALEARGLITPPGQGDVTGTGPVVADTVVVQSGTSGKAIKGSPVGVTAAGSITLPALQTVDGRDVSVDGAALDALPATIAAKVPLLNVNALSAATPVAAAIDNVYQADSTAGVITFDLPSAAGLEGHQIAVKKAAGANDVVLDGSGAETIDGAATKTIAGAATGREATALIVSDGTNWVSL